MKRYIKIVLVASLSLLLFNGCIREAVSKGSLATKDQISALPNGVPMFAAGLESKMIDIDVLRRGFHFDFGYPSLIIAREAMGQDMAIKENDYNHWSFWTNVQFLGKEYVLCAMPWHFYYSLNMNASLVERMVEPDGKDKDKEQNIWALGRAYAYKAFVYLDLAQLYQQGTYLANPDGATIPIVTAKMKPEDFVKNPRVSAKDAYAKVLEYLGLAEKYLKDFKGNSSKTEPTLSVVYGMYARTYLIMGEWEKARDYAIKAQEDYQPLTELQWRDKKNGFNTPTNNNSWMWCMAYTPNDRAVRTGLLNWAAQMSSEQNFGYSGSVAKNYKMIDAYLYSTISESDWRRHSWVEPKGDKSLIDSDYSRKESLDDYASIKFRPGQGEENDSSKATSVSVPLMRVEEMMLIEAEAEGRLDLAKGVALLNEFGLLRDEAYNFTTLSADAFINEIWRQRRIEFWGEGMSFFDIKRLNKGIKRSYKSDAGFTTNHPELSRYNTDAQPAWFDLVIPKGEEDNNREIVANPEPERPDVSEEEKV